MTLCHGEMYTKLQSKLQLTWEKMAFDEWKRVFFFFVIFGAVAFFRMIK